MWRDEIPLVRVHRDIPIRLITTPFAAGLRVFRLSTGWALLGWPHLAVATIGQSDSMFTP
jgi:hypothetical protein